MEKKEIKIKIYDDNGAVTKEVTAQALDLRFGSIRRLMELLNIDKVGNTYDLLKTVYNVWDDLIDILGECFPDVEESEWENVKVNELLPAIVNILKAAFVEMMTIPTDKKNA
jgi:hypothetical protein